MSNAVLISVQPKWCELIANGRKTIEVRKRKPKIDTPFKCYIYCSKEHSASEKLWVLDAKTRQTIRTSILAQMFGAKMVCGAYQGNGTVIGEFVCDAIYEIGVGYDDFGMRWHETTEEECTENAMCLTFDEVDVYLGRRNGYGWHISDLVIYDEPKELEEFSKPCETPFQCEKCKNIVEYFGCGNVLARPPQSWCYVDEVRE